MAEAGAGAGVGAEIMDKGGAGAGVGAENKLFRLRNTDIFPCNCFQFSALLSVLCTYRMPREILSMTVKEEGIFGGIELGSDQCLDLDPWKILWIRIRQNYADPADQDPQHCSIPHILLIIFLVTVNISVPKFTRSWLS